eukprot:3241548-Lingulodinium_polyedra.AAC.1
MQYTLNSQTLYHATRQTPARNQANRDGARTAIPLGLNTTLANAVAWGRPARGAPTYNTHARGR